METPALQTLKTPSLRQQRASALLQLQQATTALTAAMTVFAYCNFRVERFLKLNATINVDACGISLDSLSLKAIEAAEVKEQAERALADACLVYAKLVRG